MINTVYHYTSIEALMKMLHIPNDTEKQIVKVNKESGYGYYLTFYATDAYMMNDRMEHRLILDRVDKLIPKNLRTKYNSEIASIGMEILKSINSDREIYSDYMCFDECKYETLPALKAYIKTQIIEIENEYKCLPEGQISREYPFLSLYKNGILYKGEEWSYEKEWRLVWWCNHNKIKSGKYGATSYQEIKIPLRFLKEILISPSGDQEIVRYGLQKWIEANDLQRLEQYGIDLKISCSSSSLR